MVFQEKQLFNNKWHIVLFSIIICLSIGSTILLFIQQKGHFFVLLPSGLSFVLILALWFSMQLKTRIDIHGIHYQYLPFHLKERHLDWNELQAVEIKGYRPLQDYGGWGIRFGGFDFNNILLNVAGKKGIYVQLKSGRRIMIGTQKPYEAEQALEHYQNRIIHTI